MRLCYLSWRGFPFLASVDEALERLIEGGFKDKWLIDMAPRPSEIEDDNMIILTLKHLQGVFVIYAFGLLFGLLVFVFEIAYGRSGKI